MAIIGGGLRPLLVVVWSLCVSAAPSGNPRKNVLFLVADGELMVGPKAIVMMF
jgi:hypothetical protein